MSAATIHPDRRQSLILRASQAPPRVPTSQPATMSIFEGKGTSAIAAARAALSADSINSSSAGKG